MDNNAKLCDVFKVLQGLNITVEDLDFPVNIYNFLKRGDIHNLQQLLSKSINDLSKLKDMNNTQKNRKLNYIVEKLQDLAKQERENISEKLRTILNNLKGKELEQDAFHLRELVPTTPSNPADIDEFTVWEYKIGDDIIRIEYEVEDILDDIICLKLNGENVNIYATRDYKGTDYSRIYDDDAEDLFVLIMRYGGVLESQEELDYVEDYLGEEILEKRKKRAEEQK